MSAITYSIFAIGGITWSGNEKEDPIAAIYASLKNTKAVEIRGYLLKN